MTSITVFRKDNCISRFTVEGHSGYGEEGSDIVCASVSAVVWSTINGLISVAHVAATYEMQDGYVACDIPPLSEDERQQADVLLESMVEFFRNLKEQYAEFVSITEV